MTSEVQHVTAFGADIEISRCENQLVIDVATQDLARDLVFPGDDGVPRILLRINEGGVQTCADGTYAPVIMESAAETGLKTQYRNAARESYHESGALEFDADCAVSLSDGGAYVACWQWVPQSWLPETTK